MKYNRENAGPNPLTADGDGNGGGVSLPSGGSGLKLANKAECGHEKYSKPEDFNQISLQGTSQPSLLTPESTEPSSLRSFWLIIG